MFYFRNKLTKPSDKYLKLGTVHFPLKCGFYWDSSRDWEGDSVDKSLTHGWTGRYEDLITTVITWDKTMNAFEVEGGENWLPGAAPVGMQSVAKSYVRGLGENCNEFLRRIQRC